MGTRMKLILEEFDFEVTKAKNLIVTSYSTKPFCFTPSQATTLAENLDLLRLGCIKSFALEDALDTLREIYIRPNCFYRFEEDSVSFEELNQLADFLMLYYNVPALTKEDLE